MAKLILKKGEQKRVTFTVTQDGVALDLTGATLLLGVKALKTDSTYIFSKADGDFNKSQEAQGIISVLLTATNTNQPPQSYVGELKITFPDADASIDKSADITIQIQGAVT